MHYKQRFYLIILASCALTLSACSKSWIPGIDFPSSLSDAEQELPEKISQPEVVATYKFPWEVWPLRFDMRGGILKNEGILLGDHLLEQGERASALTEYRTVYSNSLSFNELEALVLRIASAELALGQAGNSLQTLTDYFQGIGTQENQVIDPRFSLIFGFAYGSIGNVEQSLAWFSRAERQSGGRGVFHDVADQGVKSLLQALSNDQFYPLAVSWANDSFIHRAVGNESQRRSKLGFVDPDPDKLRTFWAATSHTPVVGDPASFYASSHVGVLLPLSGRFAALGRSTKNGIELGLGSEVASDHVGVSVLDTAGDPFHASDLALQTISAQSPSVFLGPLLSDVATAVSDIARSNQLAQVTFSKNSFFKTGSGVFRLGPTVSSQINSLLEVCNATLGMSRFGIVFPEDRNGHEFAATFRDQLARRGLSLEFESSYFRGDAASLSLIAEQVDQYSIDGLLIPSSLDDASLFLRSLSSDSRSKIKLLGGANWYKPDELTRTSAALEGAIFVSPFFTASTRPIVSKFIEAYRSRYGTTPNFFAAQGFDAATMVAAALDRTNREGVPFQDAFSNIDNYAGVTGDISVLPDGELDRHFTVVQMRGGELFELQAQDSQAFIYRGNQEFSAEQNNLIQ